MEKNNGNSKKWFQIIFGIAFVVYALINLLFPPIFESASPQFHVWNLELRGSPAVVVGLIFAALGFLLALAGWKGGPNQ